MEGLGIACGAEPACIVLRLTLLASSKPKPPPRVKLVAERPLAFGFALLRRACIGIEHAATSQSEAPALLDIGFLLPSCSLFNAGSVLKHGLATNHCGRALAANGRTARSDAARNFDELVRPCFRLPAWKVHAFEC